MLVSILKKGDDPEPEEIEGKPKVAGVNKGSILKNKVKTMARM
jgi:hypothetical protein